MNLLARFILALIVATPFPALAQPSSPVLNRILERGYVSIGHRDASVPFSYLDNNGKPIGYSIDLCLKIVEGLKTALNRSNLEVKYVPVTSQTRVPLIANGTIDLECGSTTNNLARQKQADFLSTIYITGAKLVVRKGSGIKTIKDLKGKSVGLSQGTTSSQNVQLAAKAAGIEPNYLMVRDHPRGWLDLETGRSDAYATDDVILYGLVAKAKTPAEFEVVGDYLSYDPYSIMVPLNDSVFRNTANATLVQLMRSREIHQIYDKWFNPGPDNLNIPMSPQLKSAFELQALPD